MKTYIGKFFQDSNKERPSFLTNTNRIIKDIDVSQKPDVPPEKQIEIVLDENGALYSWRFDQSVPLGEERRDRKVALVFCKKVGDEITDRDKEKHEERTRRFQDEWNYILQNRGSIYVEPMYLNTDDLGFHNFPFSTYRRSIGEWSDWTHIQGVGSYNTGYCGLGRINGYQAWTYSPANCGWTTTAHEHGHNEGLHHDGERTNPYGGEHIMGNSGGRRSINVAQFYYKNLIDSEHVVELEVGDAKNVYLTDPDTHDMAVPMGCDKIAVCRRSESPKRYAIGLEGNRVFVYTPWMDNATTFTQTRLVEKMNLGEVFERDGVRIEYLSFDRQMAHVSIKNQTENEPGLIPVPMYPEPETNEPFNNKSGIWGNPAWSLQGVQVRYLEDRHALYVTWLTWDLSHHTRRYQGQLDIVGDVARGSIRAGREDTIVGEANIYFTNNLSGVFRAISDEFGRIAMPLHRWSAANPTGINGRFGLGNDEGLSLEQLDNGRIVGYILDYTNEGTPILPREGNTWKYLEQDEEDNVIKIYEPKYGMRGIKSRDGTLELIGTAELVGDTIELHFDDKPTKTATLSSLA